MSRVKLVIFDIGGTIIEDNGEVIAAFSEALAKNGISASAAELKPLKGSSKRDVIKYFVEREHGKENGDNEARIATAYRDFRSELENKFSNGGIKPIAGAEATFEWLKAHAIACATTTGFYRSLTENILTSAGWKSVFAANICSDDVKDGRPAPFMIFRAMEASGIGDVRQVLNIGDTPLDLQAGNRSGVCGVIGVLSGIHKKERLLAESPSHLIPSVADLPALIETHYP